MKLVVNKLIVEYQDQGTGPALLLLHGWGQSLQTYEELSEGLESSYRVICIDLPGFGGSHKPEEAWGILEYATFLEQFLEKLSIKNLHAVIGHSFGGRIGIKLAARRSDLMGRLILIDSAGIRHANSVRNQLFSVIAKTGRAVTALPGMRGYQARLRKMLYRTAGSEDYLNAGTMRAIFMKTIHEDLQSDAALISVPTTLIWGENDTDTPLADGWMLKHKIPSATLHVLESAGHFSYLDKPTESLNIIKCVLK